MEILKRFLEAVRRKRHKLWPNAWIPHRYRAPGHKALYVKHFLLEIKSFRKLHSHASYTTVHN